ncbi:MAG: hypothetical protein DME74_06035 [Verrucomicrobia bacterium]|nr:MAG: hypothetical protein DME74_06035 [Verrucomicrobiota bacterium]
MFSPRNQFGALLVSELLFRWLSIFPTSLTDSFRRGGTGGKSAGGKLNAEREMTTDFGKLRIPTFNIERGSKP